MMNPKFRKALTLSALSLVLLSGGCKRFRKTRSKPKSDAFADQLKPIVASKTIKVMHWPNYADYQPLVQTFYDDRNYEVAWVDNGQPTAQAAAFIQAFQSAAAKGLNAEDYDASLWTDRTRKLAAKDDNDTATFDAAMTVSVMRYISDLRIGRVNPTHFNFDIDVQQKKYDLPEFVSDNAVDADDVPKLIASVEPDSDQYRETEKALAHYNDLAKQQGTPEPLPAVDKPITSGGHYPAAEALAARLQLEGDLAGEPTAPEAPAPAPAPEAPKPTRTAAARASIGKAFARARGKSQAAPAATEAAAPPAHVPSTVYTADLADAVKHYQSRHSLTANGQLTAATVTSLNVPLTARSQQLADSLERLRWLPDPYLHAPLQVNLPEFVLRGFGEDHQQQFKMNVVVGQVVGEHQTPVFTHMMKYVIFRPFWNVPVSIIKKELAGHIAKSGVGYLEAHNFETVDAKGAHVNASAESIERGGVVVREKPGPKNSLGLIKFMFPNEYDIYLHSTPAQQLFARSRRDFSHGCVRVEHPDQLAVWVLQNTPRNWDLQKVTDAMQNGADNHQVNLTKQIPIVIFYATARVDENGQVDFFDDIYHYDKQLEDVLAKGMPYPSQQQHVDPKTKFGDTT
ncbi:L,D-transpeptidase family protein [Granulicella tundricola]|uniref:ErfK/YbiS/YcfS/YnhG family protein n=1 Tax=Granulicella tundricola (strain ATCC BAA-1859 / DSM 23138 / MP5ACTX9) TaxID=1198114 RepID=E8WXC1_GRATM|nr:L,D-transpeptidase family protein [Granulicella tundricola]ADW67454.1 ErfK/YbiS/YcfS/YnhG family protein [Granulicella tundricola MP5ACTX9]